MARDPVLMHAANARAASRRYGIPTSIILAILSVEGGTDAQGRPVKPGDGLGPPSYAQITSGTARSIGGVRYGDSASEVDALARILIEYGWKDDRHRAIGAYNGGPGNPQESYAAKVEAAAKGYQAFDTPGANPLHEPAPSAPAAAAGGNGLVDAQQHSTLVRFGVAAALVLFAVAAIAAGTARATGVRPPAKAAARA